MNFLSTQMIFSWTLLGVLLAWMFAFAFLAFRSPVGEKREATDLPTPSGAFSAIVPRTPLFSSSPPSEIVAANVPAVSNDLIHEVDVAPVV